jgi:spore maturation protein CgeB
MSDLRGRNQAALTSLFTDDLERVRAGAPGAGISVVPAKSGAVVLDWGGRALDSRRDPVRAAASAAAETSSPVVVVAGFGGGYLVEALRARGIQVAAVVDHAAVFDAAMGARDLSTLLAAVPVVTIEGLAVRGRLAQVRALAPVIVAHAPSVTASPELRQFCTRWHDVRAARPPRVLTVGPIAGGSLEVARSVHRAASRLGADTRLFDASVFAGSQNAFLSLAVSTESRKCLHGKLALLVGEAIVEDATTWRPDLVLALAQAPLSEPSLTALRQRGIPTAFWFVENARVLPYWRDVARHYDRFYAIQPGRELDRIRAAGAPHVSCLPMAADPEVHAVPELTDADRVRFGSPVSFAGAPYLNRRHVLSAVADLGLKLWGDGWESTPLAGYLAEQGRFDLETMRRVFAATAVNLNVHSADHVTGLDPDPDYVNPRTFELAMMGAFQLVDRRDQLPSLFDDSELTTFASVREMRSLAQHFLASPDEARTIAARAADRARRDHTYDQRVGVILAESLPAHLQPLPARTWGEASASRSPHTLDAALTQASTTPSMEQDEIYLRMLADIRQTVGAR